MTTLIQTKLAADSLVWSINPGGPFASATKFYPYFLSKTNMEYWHAEYKIPPGKFYTYKRVTTDKGYTFLVYSSAVVMSPIAGLQVNSGVFLSKYGKVVKTSQPMYSILAPLMIMKFTLNGGDLTLAHSNWYLLIDTFIEEAVKFGLSDNAIAGLTAKCKPKKKKVVVTIDKTLDDFCGLIDKKQYDSTIVPYALVGNTFFVTRGPKRGMFLTTTSTENANWIYGDLLFRANTKKDLVCGDEDEEYQTESSNHTVSRHQGFFIGVKD